MTLPLTAPRFYPKGTLPLRPDVAGASYWAVALQQAMLSYFEVEAGARFPEHAHDSEQITLVLTGSLILHLRDREVRVGPGEVIAIPGQVPHGVSAGPDGATAVDAWSPVRAELQPVVT